ncbi:MAG: DNA polymerase III subunit alpha [Leptonema sp. (in: Bacteria)]|nr:DNA polymerase III subunit alpha [Leptonema sp. (in: bacteria)]
MLPTNDTSKQFNQKFTHLHLHTTYSLLDGAIRIDELMKHCKANGMDSVAITDHGNMFGVVNFYQQAIKHGVKPIIGNEFYVAPGKMTETRTMENIADGNNYHLVLLAQNETGYKNLIKLTSRSYTDGFYRKPRIDYDLLADHSEGVICLTACLGGEVQRKVLSGKQNEAESLVNKLQEMFGRDRFYLEIQRHGITDQETVAKIHLEMSKRLGVPLVLTNDSHFLTKTDHLNQDILLRINQKKTIDEPLLFGFNDQFYVKSPFEMWSLFPEIPQAFHNTQQIADMVDLNFQFGNPLLPKFEVPAGHNLNSYFRELAETGLKRRYGNPIPKQMIERFEFELKVITEMDFPGYFLIVQDFINWAKNQGIPVGPGRGSAAGSIVAYSLGITDIDPIRYNLLFERFLNPDRKEMPDIDVDFCVDRREEVINYVKSKYGRDNVAQIITYGTMAAKACIKDVARVLKMPFSEANKFSAAIPSVPKITLEQALEDSPEFKRLTEADELSKKVFSVAKALEGNSRQTGVHAAGVVIAPEPLEHLVPLATVTNPANKEEGRILVTQFDMNTIAQVGLVKMDFLGLRNLTVIDNAIKGIEEHRGIKINLNELTLDDPKTYKLLQTGNLKGVFQLETSAGMRDFVIRLQPETFEDLIALIAMFRPGPLNSGMADAYINRKKGREKVVYPHPHLEEILQETYGVILYQEQVMQIAQRIGGFSRGQSDALRKAMGKKIKEKMAEMKQLYLKGAEQLQYDFKFAESLYDDMAAFAEYGFNKSHSAAYAMLVYQTAYLKANYTADYMRAVLDSERSNTDSLVPYIRECRDLNLTVKGPDINSSELHFSLEDETTLRFGLSAIKGVGESAVIGLIQSRNQTEERKFKSFYHFLETIDLQQCNKRMLEALIYSGSFDSLGYTRKALVEAIEMGIQQAQAKKRDADRGQSSLFGDTLDESEPIPKGEGVREFTESERLRAEKQVLGIYFSGHPMKKYERALKSIRSTPIERLSLISSQSKVEIAAVIDDVQIRAGKNKREYARLQIEDLTGTVSAIAFAQIVEKKRDYLVKDSIVWIKATVEVDDDTGVPTVLVDDIEPLTDTVIEEKQERSLHLKLRKQVMDESTLNGLLQVLKSSRGPLMIYFHIQPDTKEEPTVIRAHESFCVEWNQELAERLKSFQAVEGVYLSVGGNIRPLIEIAS